MRKGGLVQKVQHFFLNSLSCSSIKEPVKSAPISKYPSTSLSNIISLL